MSSVSTFAALGWVSLVCSCAARPASVGASVVDAAVSASAQPAEAGFFPLPPALSQNPLSVAIPPLEFKVVKPEKLQLENGLTLYLLPDHSAPLVQLEALSFAGSVDDPAQKAGLADLTFSLIASGGSGKLDADALDETFERLAADASSSAGEELSSVSLNLRSQDLETLLPIFAQLLRAPRFQPDRLESARARYRESIRRRTDSPEGLAARAVRKAVYGPASPMAREATGATLKQIGRADLVAFYREALTPAATALLVSGDFDPAALIPKLRALFGDWKGAPRRKRAEGTPPPLQRRVFWVPKETPQTKIRIGGRGFARHSPREYAIRVLNSAMSGFGVGRVYKDLRDRKGMAYSATAIASAGPEGGLFVTSVDTRTESALPAIDAALEVLGSAAGEDPLSSKEIATAKDISLNSFAFRFDAAGKIVRERAILDFFGYPENYLDRFRDEVAAVQPSAVAEAAKGLYDLAALQIVIVGPVVPPSAEKLGPVTRVDDVERWIAVP